MPHEVALRRVLYEIPGMETVSVRDAEFAGANGAPLAMRSYGNESAPLVVILEGYPDAGFAKHVGCRFMDMQWTISMAQLLAASGLKAVTHSNREPLADAIALLRHVCEAGRPVGIWATSGHAPTALEALAHATCGVLTNPIVGDPLPHQPMFIVRSGMDETPGLNVKLDAFLARGIEENRPITVVNYPGAPHAFELNCEGPMTRHILEQAMAFLRVYLAA